MEKIGLLTFDTTGEYASGSVVGDLCVLEFLANLISKNKTMVRRVRVTTMQGSLISDWSKGYKRTETDIFNERVK